MSKSQKKQRIPKSVHRKANFPKGRIRSQRRKNNRLLPKMIFIEKILTTNRRNKESTESRNISTGNAANLILNVIFRQRIPHLQKGKNKIFQAVKSRINYRRKQKKPENV